MDVIKVFVTGHRGKIGSILVSELDKAGYNVITYDGNLNDYTSLKDFLSQNNDTKVIINTVAKFRGSAVDMINSNVATAANLGQVISELDIGAHIIHFSTGGVYAPTSEEKTETAPLLAPTVYTLAKKMGEDVLNLFLHEKSNIFTILRPGSVYGPGIEDGFLYWFEQKAKNGELIELKGADTKIRSVVHIEYLIKCILYLIEYRLGGVYNIASDKITLGESISILKRKYPSLELAVLPEDTNNDKLTHMSLNSSKIQALIKVTDHEKIIY